MPKAREQSGAPYLEKFGDPLHLLNFGCRVTVCTLMSVYTCIHLYAKSLIP